MGQDDPQELRDALVGAAARYPAATEAFPWGERVAKVDGKIFAYLGRDESDDVAMAFKLAESAAHALSLAAVEPTGHGLGKAGWVTVHLGRPDRPDLELLAEWLEESYRTVARTHRVTELDQNPVQLDP